MKVGFGFCPAMDVEVVKELIRQCVKNDLYINQSATSTSPVVKHIAPRFTVIPKFVRNCDTSLVEAKGAGDARRD